jgi:hypothetical protein
MNFFQKHGKFFGKRKMMLQCPKGTKIRILQEFSFGILTIDRYTIDGEILVLDRRGVYLLTREENIIYTDFILEWKLFCSGRLL